MNSHAFSKIWIIIVIIVLVAGGILAWQYFGMPREEVKAPEEKVPEEIVEDETANWKTYRNEEYGFEMRYPEEFFPEQVLQPKTKITQCDYANFLNNCPTEVININGIPFCLQETGGAAAGTAYVTYNYTTVRNTECFVVFFTVPYPNCSNYLPIESPEIQEAYDKCRLDNEVTKPKIINQMLSTFRFIEYIEILSPNKGERWIEENSYTIQWEQKGLANWGDKVTICLIGLDVKGEAISAKESWRSPACAYAVSSDGLSSYLIDKTTLTAEKYNWTIPKNLFERFETQPYNFKVSLLVFDELPPEGRTEWAGLIAQDESDGYVSIVEK